MKWHPRVLAGIEAAVPFLNMSRVRYQVLRIAIPRRCRALPLLQVAYDRGRLLVALTIACLPSTSFRGGYA